MKATKGFVLRGHDPVSSEREGRRGARLAERVEAGKSGRGSAAQDRRTGIERVAGYRPPNRKILVAAYLAAQGVGRGARRARIHEASVGSFGPESIVGPDDRVRISPASRAPWRWICSLDITAQSGARFIGTGWFIGPHTLMTAGHCVYMHEEGGWARSIRVVPGRDASSSPYGSATATSFRTVGEWIQGADTNFDYGAIVLPNDTLGNRVGWFGFGVLPDASLDGLMANLSGYPGDKPPGTHWFHARRVSGVNPKKILYDIDTFGGQSGSPVWRLQNGQRTAVAIHTTGGGGTRPNSGTRVTTPVYNNMVLWKA